MPLLDSLPQSEKIDCSVNSPRASSLLCRLLPLGLRYDVSQVDTGDGQTVRVLFSAQSSDAIIYVTVVVFIYIVVFVALVITSYRKNAKRANAKAKRRRNRQHKKQRLADTVVECDTNGVIKCQTNETVTEATCV